MSRWIELYTTSNSGKTLFVCKMCGRITPLPDKECPRPPQVVSYKATMACSLLEDIEAALIDAGEQKLPSGVELYINMATEQSSKQGGTDSVSWRLNGKSYRSVKAVFKRKAESE